MVVAIAHTEAGDASRVSPPDVADLMLGDLAPPFAPTYFDGVAILTSGNASLTIEIDQDRPVDARVSMRLDVGRTRYFEALFSTDWALDSAYAAGRRTSRVHISALLDLWGSSLRRGVWRCESSDIQVLGVPGSVPVDAAQHAAAA
jgi:hypothetical protein